MRKYTASFQVRRLVMLSLMVAAEIVLNRFLSINTMGIKIGFSFVPIVIAAYLFGPLYAGISYALSDFIGAILFPIGTYHPGFTVCAFLMGIAYGLFLYKKDKPSVLKNVIPPVLINNIVFGLLINTIWVSMLYGSKTYIGWFLYRLTEYALLIPVSIILIPTVIGVCKIVNKSSYKDAPKEKHMNYNEALEYIHGISWTFCKPGLERISELCDKLGNPERELKFVHVAGTNGKGSFCSMLSSVLCEAGYRTGLFTSPYIVEFNERMRVNGENITNDELAKITEFVKPIADSMTEKPTEFELITAIALEYFRRKKVEVVVFECGMGGRLDSTNVIPSSLLSVITGIALDHVAFLGDTTEKIAAEKAGIIKPHGRVLFGGESPEAETVIRARADELGAVFHKTDYTALNVTRVDLSGTEFSYKTRENVNISLLGEYQPRNCALVLEAIDVIRAQGFDISESAIYEGLRKAKWPARFEIISKEPLIIFDGAHNAEGISVAVKSIKQYFGNERVICLSGVLRDKDYGAISSDIARIAERVYTITPDSPRALTAEEYSECYRALGIDTTPSPDTKTAFNLARDMAKAQNRPLVILGSLYTYIEIKKIMEETK